MCERVRVHLRVCWVVFVLVVEVVVVVVVVVGGVLQRWYKPALRLGH